MSFACAKVRQNFHIIRQIHEKYHDLADYENEITINQCRRDYHLLRHEHSPASVLLSALNIFLLDEPVKQFLDG